MAVNLAMTVPAGASRRPALFLEEIEHMIPPPPDLLDGSSAASLQALRRRAFERRVSLVNASFVAFRQLWPKGSPLDYFVALELCCDDPDATCERLCDASFVRAVVLASRERCAPDAFSPPDASSDEESAPRRRAWTAPEVDRLRRLIEKHGARWQTISAKLKGRTPKQCQCCAEKRGIAPDAPARKIARAASLTFLRAGERFPVGYRQSRFDEAKFLNPLPGAIDPVTNDPMTMPAISPDGYVCDYSTWMRILAETKVNPFTQRAIRSKRELIVLTVDNFNQYRDRIINLDVAWGPANAAVAADLIGVEGIRWE
jgi:hypothetical protein